MLPDNKKLVRKFFNNNKVQDLINYVRKETGKGANEVQISKTFPKKMLTNLENTLL